MRRVRPQSVASSGAVASCLLSFFLSSPRCPFGLSFEGSQGDPRRHQHRHRHHLNLSRPTRSRSFFSLPRTTFRALFALPFVEIGALSSIVRYLAPLERYTDQRTKKESSTQPDYVFHQTLQYLHASVVLHRMLSQMGGRLPI